jgi:LPXTG-site transpeptidase (sortase) family protein
VLDFFRPIPKKRTIKLHSKQGVLYNNPGTMGKAVFHLGNVLFFVAIFYGIYLYFPLAKAVWGYNQLRTQNVIVDNVSPLPPLPTPTVIDIGTTEYSITIPRIGAYASIVSDVSPFDQAAYSKVLKDSVVAQAKGSSNPGGGTGKSTFIFAHSTQQGLNLVRQNAVFYLLGELKNGDVVFINDSGKIHTYKVYMSKIVKASEIEYLKYSDPLKEVVIMQTCWPIGTDWKRLLVFAEKV